jgi:hypothetical protein
MQCKRVDRTAKVKVYSGPPLPHVDETFAVVSFIIRPQSKIHNAFSCHERDCPLSLKMLYKGNYFRKRVVKILGDDYAHFSPCEYTFENIEQCYEKMFHSTLDEELSFFIMLPIVQTRPKFELTCATCQCGVPTKDYDCAALMVPPNKDVWPSWKCPECR